MWATSILPSLYRRYAGREPDAAGLAFWTAFRAAHPEWSDAEMTAKWLTSAGVVLEGERISGVALPRAYVAEPIPAAFQPQRAGINPLVLAAAAAAAWYFF